MTHQLNEWKSEAIIQSFVPLWEHAQNMLFALKVYSWLSYDLVCSFQCAQRLEQNCADELLSILKTELQKNQG